MTNTIDYYFATPSPWAYLATPRIIEIEKKYDIKINWKPCNLVEIFAKNGTAAVKDRPKPVQLNRLTELKRWSQYLNVPLTVQPKFFPVDPTLSQKVIIVAQNSDIDPKDITFAFMKAVWAEEKDIANEETIKEISQNCNLDSTTILEIANSSEINNKYIENTEKALENNVWGSPTFIYNNELFWGQDRIEFLERAIQNN